MLRYIQNLIYFHPGILFAFISFSVCADNPKKVVEQNAFAVKTKNELPVKPQSFEDPFQYNSPADKETKAKFIGIVKVYDEKAFVDFGPEFISEETKLETLADGFRWAEGPLWIEELQCLVFSDIPNNRVNKYCPTNEIDGEITTFLDDSGKSNGLALDQRGRLLLMQSGERRVAVMDSALSAPQSRYLVQASTHRGKKLNSPNDVTIHSSGSVYFTDPAYGLKDGLQDPEKELDFQGVYKFNPNSGELILLDDELSFPNGIEFAKGERHIVVAVSDRDFPAWYRYDVNANGTLENRILLLDAREYMEADAVYQKGLPDGLKLHKSSGVFFATGPGGVWLFNIDGKLIAKIMVPDRPVANIAFNRDQSAIYLTAKNRLLRVKFGS